MIIQFKKWKVWIWDGYKLEGVGVGGQVKVGIKANSAQPTELKLDGAGLSLVIVPL